MQKEKHSDDWLRRSQPIFAEYFGSVKSEKLGELVEKNPEKLFKLATRGMLPKTKLGRAMLKKLRVYAGSEHPHTAQVKAKG